RSLRSPDLRSFPTRRSSDLVLEGGGERRTIAPEAAIGWAGVSWRAVRAIRTQRRLLFLRPEDRIEPRQFLSGNEWVLMRPPVPRGRKSTRLNSSHVAITYAV